MTPDEAELAALDWYGEAGGLLLQALTANELAGIVNEAIEKERESCAKECEITSNHPSSLWEEPGCWKHSAQNCADAIRSRSKCRQ